MNSITITQLRESNVTRRATCEINLGDKKKTITIPFFGLSLSAQADLAYASDWVEENGIGSLQMISAPIFDAKKIFAEKESKKFQQGFDRQFIEKGYRALCNGVVFIVDPQTEKTLLSIGTQKRIDVEDLEDIFTKTVRQVAASGKNKGKKETIFRNFLDHLTDSSKRTKFVTSLLKKQKKCGADLLLAPTPVIHPHFKDSLELSFKINKLTQELCQINEGWMSCFYFVLHPSALETKEIVEKILAFINEQKPNIICFKLLFAETLDRKENYFHRENIKYLAEGLKQSRELFKTMSFWLDIDTIGLFLIGAGIDGFTTPINGIITKPFVPSKNAHKKETLKGNYLHYSKLINIKFNILNEIYQNNKKVLPCHCKYCEQLNGRNLESLTRLEKARFTRMHYLSVINMKLAEIHKCINKNQMRTFGNTLVQSACAHYMNLLPNNLFE